MRFFVPFVFLSFFKLSGAESTSSWNWHQQFPWVYSEAESGWHYWRAGTDGHFYLWKDKDQTWYRFDTAKSTWVSTIWDSYFPVPMVRAIRMTVPRIPYGAGTTRTVPKNKQMISLVPFPSLFLTTDSPGNTSSMSPPLILVISKSLCSLIFTAMAEHPAGI